MKICIYGAGSLGTVLGAFMSKAGIDVDLVSRNAEHIGGLKKNGAVITGTLNMSVPVKALLTEEMKDRYDLIFLMTKQQDNKNVVEGLKANLTEEGVICTMQNGLPEKLISETIGEEKTFGCAVEWGATMLGKGVCELTSDPEGLTFNLGTPGKSNGAKMEEIKQILECMGSVIIEKNFIGARWAKLLVNSSFSGMATVLGCTFGGVAENKKARLCAQRVIQECIDVAKKSNIKVEPIQGNNVAKLFDGGGWLKQKFVYMIIPMAIKKHRLLKPSMLQDIEKGKKCEIESINGVVCSYGDMCGCPTPYNDLIVETIEKIENGMMKPSMDNLKFFEKLG